MTQNPEPPPIHLVRGQRVMLDRDLAKLYGVTTMAFNQAVRRNLQRFPPDFVFQLTIQEFRNLISQIVISTQGEVDGSASGHGGTRKPALAFTEHGAIMAAMVLRSQRALAMSVYVVRAFVHLRDETLSHTVILKQLALHDKKLLEHDVVLQDVVEKLLPLLQPPEAPNKPRIGFYPDHA
jgi:hypothetical protein